ncbi:SAM-dependent methyltransferase [Streptomyces sp. NBC_01294]|uniref:SAM-dependent methyltransferase n=1 Tax=Streptomyces sp. NBC_01294 TaxID=2903815 RepID=UPI002DDA45B1|nr:class I SAM-dependent methyltransferase [Streptomyces sp. NBC_01294]WRZ59452.1 class I SAM-dependent methyltransferase [Streptomyces sp. NBC_01294]
MTEHTHTHSHHSPAPGTAAGEEFWDGRYEESDRIWSGEANAMLVHEASGLAPGRALDLGCGEGGDAVWLARRGWTVTGTDISGVALGRAAEHAAEAGVADRVSFARHDLTESFPQGEFDLVSACFLHNYGDFPRDVVLRTAAAAVAPGGTLLVVGHAGWAPWQEDREEAHFPTPEEVLGQLEPVTAGWEVLRAEETERVQEQPDGTPGTRTDNVVRVRRPA